MISLRIWAALALASSFLAGQDWAGRRVVTLSGFGDYYTTGPDGQPALVKPDGLGVNIVAVVGRVDSDRVWLRSNGAGDEPVGWVRRADAILLDDAIPYFTARIARDPLDWDAFLRRAEAEHALNQRDAAVADYTRAIGLRPGEAFLFLRRGREFRILNACGRSVADFESAARLRPAWAEPYNLEAGVYSDCADPSFRDQQKSIERIQRAIALDPNPVYLTVLASAFFRSGQMERAVAAQKQALDSPRFPPGYREDAARQLREYEAALPARKR